MFSKLKRLIGSITVEVKKDHIFVEGVPADVIARDIKRIWGNRVLGSLFTDLDKNSFSFHEFFCIDILYAIDTMIADKTVKASRHSLGKIRDELLENTWLKNIDKEFPSKLDYSKLDLFHKTPLEHQKNFFPVYDQITQQYGLKGIMLAAAAGGGKSIASIMLMELLGKDQIIIVSPNNALERVWGLTLANEFKKPPTYWVTKRNVALRGDEKYIVINYEYLGNFLKEVHKLKGKNVGIILDESHNFNTHDSLRTELFVQLCSKVNSTDTLWMSGTPIKALSTEAIPLFRTIVPTFTKEVEERFKKIFGVSSERATDILNNRLGFTSFKVEKKELAVLPPIFKDIKVVIPDAERFTLESISKDMFNFTQERTAYYKSREKEDKEVFDKCLAIHQRSLKDSSSFKQFEAYQQFLKVVIRSGGDVRFAKDEIIYCNKYENTKIVPSLPQELKAQFRDVKSIIKYVKLKIQGECLGRIVGKARTDCHVAMCTHIDYVGVIESTEKKAVLFTSFVPVVEKLQEYLPTLGLSPEYVYAKTNNRLAAIISEFEKDENINPLVATYASLSTAVPLTMADVCVLIDAPFRDYVLQQTVSRISRIGSTTQTYCYTASLDTGDKPNISSRSFDILKWSQQQTEAIIGIKSPFEISDNLEQANLALEGLDALEASTPFDVPDFAKW